MKFTVALLAFFGTLAIGQNKPMTMDTELDQSIKYVFDYGTGDKEHALPVVDIDKSELIHFCEDIGDADGIPRTLNIIENYGDDDPSNLYFTCLIADDNTAVPTMASTTSEDTHDEPENLVQNIPMSMDREFDQNIKYVFDYGISDKEYSLPVVHLDKSELTHLCEDIGDADGIPRTLKIIENYGDNDPSNFYFTCLIADDNTDVRTTALMTSEDTHDEPENLVQNMRMLITDPEFVQNFFYVFNYGEDKEMPVAAPVHRMSALPAFCKNRYIWNGEQRRVKIIERDDDPSNVYFICERPEQDTYVPTTVPTPQPTTSDLGIADPEFEHKFYYIFHYGDKDKEVVKLAPVGRMSELSLFCENEVFWNGEKRRLNIIEVNDDPRNVYFICVIAEDNTDVPTTASTTPEYTHDDSTTEKIITQTTEPGSTESTVVLYKLIGEGYKYHPSIDAWMKVHTMPEDWHDARLRCLHEGSTLASPIDTPMLEAMQGLLGNKVSVAFTGISADYASGYFYSVEGVSLNEIPAAFVSGKPEDSDGCIGMYPNGTLTVLRCDSPKPFICYVKDSDVPEIPSPCGTDPDYVFERRTGKCYKFHTFGRTWSSAFMTCATEGGHLAIINSDEEAEVVVDLVNKFPESAVRSEYPGITLLGFRDWSEHRTWMTIHGQTLQKAGYSRWGANEPNDPRSEFCGSMFRNGELNDTLCRSPMPFVCEKKPAGLPKGTNKNSDR